MRITASLAACLLVMGCASAPRANLPSAAAVEYRLGPGDKLRVDVYRVDEMSGEYTVDGDGRITLPLAGKFDASGLTADALQAAITSRLSTDFVKDARVTVSVVSFRPFYVLGEVNQPGEFAYVPGMTVYAAVAKAGGFTYRADRHKAFVRHQGEAQERAYALSSGAALLPGDTIRIGERFF